MFHWMKSTLAVVTLSVAASAVPALAQDFPSRPIRLVVPFAPGGVSDIVARAYAQGLEKALGQGVVVENRAGASGNIGTEMVARAAPDGYTLLLAFDGTIAINPHVYAKTGFDPVKDFAPITKIGNSTQILVAKPALPVSSLSDLIARGKAMGTLNYGSSGTASQGHVSGEMLRIASGLALTHIPYKGGSPAMADVMGGHVPVFAANIGSSLTNIKAGKLRPLAIMSSSRSAQLPDVPTLAEAGVANSETFEWNGMFVPTGVPPAITAKLSDALKKALDAPDFKDQIAKVGGELFLGGNAEAVSFIQIQFDRMGKIIREGNIRPE